MAQLQGGVTHVAPGSFDPDKHFYPRVLNAQIHPLVRFFLSLGNERIAERFCHMHPEARPQAVRDLLSTPTANFRWAGADLFCTTNEVGRRQMVVVETNSCPSGQKSMPRYDEDQEQAGFRVLLERTLLPMLQQRRGLPDGGYAVLYDKNPMEASGYAAALADLVDEPVHVVALPADDPDPWARFEGGVLMVRDDEGRWTPMRAAFRYVTQRPWTRIPPLSRTLVFNPVLCCLAGGRNKALAAKAYDLYNADLRRSGLALHTPETIWDVSLEEVPLWIERMGGVGVVKVPYSNAGQGVYTITSPGELDAFMRQEHHYERFIVQGLIGNSGWSSLTRSGRLYHIGTVPDRRSRIYVADLRFMVGVGVDGFFPVAIYARRTREPLATTLVQGTTSWDMLGTNLSVRAPDGGWTTETERLVLMDNRDFNKLGIGLDDLIEGYVQTVMACGAIDRLGQHLTNRKGGFRHKLFASMNPDPVLLREVMR